MRKKMSKRDLMRNRNVVARLVRFQNRSGSHRNCIRFSRVEGFKHFLAKCLVCWRLAGEGTEFLTEARYIDGSRGDVLCLDTNTDYEILNTEEPFKAEIKKVRRYPVEIEMVDADLEVKKLKRRLDEQS
jgi:hypothetical protein